MFQQNPIPKKLAWQLMYEGPDLGHLLAYQVFIKPFLAGGSLLSKFSGFQYNYYLWYSDKNEVGGIHGGYYVKSDLSRATKHGEKIYFNNRWLASWYKAIDDDCKKVYEIMRLYKMEDKLDKIKKTDLVKILPEMILLEYRLLTFVRCSQPQLTDALKNKLYDILNKYISDENEIEKVFVELTLPEEKSFFTYEELAWLDIVIKAEIKINSEDINYLTAELLSENYLDIWKMLKNHFNKFKLIPASDRTPAWDLNYFIDLLKTSLKSNNNHREKREQVSNQYDEAINIKKSLLKKYNLPKEAFVIGSRISKVGYYRFKASFFWRWMGYYMVLICEKYSKNLGLSYKEMASMTAEELLSALSGYMLVGKEELKRRSEAELFMHADGKDYIWWGDEARQKKLEILGAVDYDKLNEIKGEVGNTGIIRGIAYVFHWSDDVAKKVHKMPKGSILVAPQTHPTYMPAIRLAKALVCDEGGVTGHAAIVSRELKKPCVIGLHIATKAIHTGDELEVDANNGVVKILKRKI